MANEYVNDFNECVQFYYEELKSEKYKPINKADERELIIKAKKGDYKSRDKILNANLRFVFEMAKNYTGRGVSIDDLIAEGNLGMMKAIEKFNTDYDVKFFSYAVWWIKQYMKSAINKCIAKDNVEGGEDEISSSIINNKIPDNEDEVVNKSETIMSNEEDEYNAEMDANKRIVVENLLVKLDDRERVIIENYYGIGGVKEKNLEEIGVMLDISKERVRQIKMSSLKKMRCEILTMENAEFLWG